MGVVQWFSAEDEMRDKYYLMIRKGIEDYCIAHSISIVRVFKTDGNYREELSDVNGIICIGKFGNRQVEEFMGLCDNVIFSLYRYRIYICTIAKKNKLPLIHNCI
jgi:LacI family transcriptional regulator